MERFPKRPRSLSAQRDEMIRNSVVRFKPFNSRSSSIECDESMSSSVSDGEMRRALGKVESACLAIDATAALTLRTRNHGFAQSLSDAMRLPTNMAEAIKAREQIKAQAVKDEPVFWKKADTREAVKVTGEAREPHSTQCVLSLIGQATASSSDKARVIDNAILQSKIKNQNQKYKENHKKTLYHQSLK